MQDRQVAGVAGFGVVNDGEILGSSLLAGKVAGSRFGSKRSDRWAGRLLLESNQA